MISVDKSRSHIVLLKQGFMQIIVLGCLFLICPLQEGKKDISLFSLKSDATLSNEQLWMLIIM